MSKQDIELMTKVEFVEWFMKQPKKVQWELVTTAYDSDSRIGRGRRLMIKALQTIYTGKGKS